MAKKQHTEHTKELADNLRIRMAAMNISPKELSSLTGINIRTVNSMMKGEHDFTIDEIASLEDALQFDFLIIPDKERTITVKMNIDSTKNRASVGYAVTENGKPKEQWTPSEMLSTAQSLLGIAFNYIMEVNAKVIALEKGIDTQPEIHTTNKQYNYGEGGLSRSDI